MRIAPVTHKTNTLKFGYNKELNRQLTARLNQAPNTGFYQSIKRINLTCNKTEDVIRALEKEDIDKNSPQINMLFDYFLPAKLFLSKTIDKLFPDLKYSSTECDTYDEEFSNMHSVEDMEHLSEAEFWRMTLVDRLIDYCEEDDELPVEERMIPSDIRARKLANLSKSDEELVEKYEKRKDSPNSLDDVIGLKNTRNDIEDLIIYPLLYPEEAKQRETDYGIEQPSFIMFYGPPGCGKTMLAEAICNYTGSEMYLLDLSKVGSHYINESSSNVARAFEYVYKQAESSHKPVILFMDEMDSLLSKRREEAGGASEDNKVVNTLLTLITKSKDKNVLIIGATNMYNMIDTAAKRRADLEQFIGLPDKDEIIKLLEKNLSKIKKGEKLAQDKEALCELSNVLSGYSPAVIVNKVLKHASRLAFRDGSEIQKEHFLKALKEGTYEKIKVEEYLPENKKRSKKIGFGQ